MSASLDRIQELIEEHPEAVETDGWAKLQEAVSDLPDIGEDPEGYERRAREVAAIGEEIEHELDLARATEPPAVEQPSRTAPNWRPAWARQDAQAPQAAKSAAWSAQHAAESERKEYANFSVPGSCLGKPFNAQVNGRAVQKRYVKLPRGTTGPDGQDLSGYRFAVFASQVRPDKFLMDAQRIGIKVQQTADGGERDSVWLRKSYRDEAGEYRNIEGPHLTPSECEAAVKAWARAHTVKIDVPVEAVRTYERRDGSESIFVQGPKSPVDGNRVAQERFYPKAAYSSRKDPDTGARCAQFKTYDTSSVSFMKRDESGKAVWNRLSPAAVAAAYTADRNHDDERRRHDADVAAAVPAPTAVVDRVRSTLSQEHGAPSEGAR